MKLSLISCNIRFDNPADGSNAWIHRREILKDILLKHSPDIIATQEGRYDQLKDLLTLLPDFEMIDQHRSWIKERMYPTLFLRSGKFEIGKSEDIWLSETPGVAGSRSFDSAFPRLMTCLKLQPKNFNKSFTVVNTHLDHVKAETRLAQVKVLIQELKRQHIKDSLVIMGDFNDGPESDVRKTLLSEFPGLQDSWKLFNHVEETSHHAFKGEMQNGSRIDWILVDKNFQVESCSMDKTHVKGTYPTDHFPVICQTIIL